MHTSRVTLAAAFLLLSTTLFAQQDDLDRAGTYLREAREAYGRKDFAKYLEASDAAAKLRPQHQSILFNLAGALALNGQKDAALNVLDRLGRMGMTVPFEEEKDLDAIRADPRFQEVAAAIVRNRQLSGHASIVFRADVTGAIPEGIVFDARRNLYLVSSVRERRVMAVSPAGVILEKGSFDTGALAPFGMAIDQKRDDLWIATSAVPEMKGFTPELEGTAAVLRYSLRTGRQKNAYPAGKGHMFGDLIVDPDGIVWISDGGAGVVQRLDPGRRGGFTSVSGGGLLSSPQGLTLSEDRRTLYLADYRRGIIAIDVATGDGIPLAVPEGSTLLGIDGLYRIGDDLIGVQNGTKPTRVVRISLNGLRVKTVTPLVANDPAMDDPTLGTVLGNRFVFIANGQWEASGAEQPDAAILRPLTVLSLCLAETCH